MTFHRWYTVVKCWRSDIGTWRYKIIVNCDTLQIVQMLFMLFIYCGAILSTFDITLF